MGRPFIKAGKRCKSCIYDSCSTYLCLQKLKPSQVGKVFTAGFLTSPVCVTFLYSFSLSHVAKLITSPAGLFWIWSTCLLHNSEAVTHRILTLKCKCSTELQSKYIVANPTKSKDCFWRKVNRIEFPRRNTHSKATFRLKFETSRNLFSPTVKFDWRDWCWVIIQCLNKDKVVHDIKDMNESISASGCQ